MEKSSRRPRSMCSDFASRSFFARPRGAGAALLRKNAGSKCSFDADWCTLVRHGVREQRGLDLLDQERALRPRRGAESQQISAETSDPPDGRWRTSNPPPGESLDAKWWPDRDLGKAFRRWTGIPPARGDQAQSGRDEVPGRALERRRPDRRRDRAPNAPAGDRAAGLRRTRASDGRCDSACTARTKRPRPRALLAMGEDVLPVLRDLFPGASGSIAGSPTCSPLAAGACRVFAEPWWRLASRPLRTSSSFSSPRNPKLATTRPGRRRAAAPASRRAAGRDPVRRRPRRLA